jgi:hypothetical protein
MKFIYTFVLTALLVAAAPAQSKLSLNDLTWISGCWELNRPNRQTFVNEQWMLPMGNSMLGMSRTVRDGKLAEFEYLRIVQKGDEISYIALPSANEKAETFKMISGSKSQITFENKEHDFPQRIIYTLNPDGTLLAAVEGAVRDRPRRNEFLMTKVKCAQ